MYIDIHIILHEYHMNKAYAGMYAYAYVHIYMYMYMYVYTVWNSFT